MRNSWRAMPHRPLSARTYARVLYARGKPFVSLYGHVSRSLSGHGMPLVSLSLSDSTCDRIERLFLCEIGLRYDLDL